jgi:hypothetical protein
LDIPVYALYFLHRTPGVEEPALLNLLPMEKTMSLIHLLLILVAVGVILWLIDTYIPMQATIKNILNAVVVIAVIIWLMNVFGLLGKLSAIRVGK